MTLEYNLYTDDLRVQLSFLTKLEDYLDLIEDEELSIDIRSMFASYEVLPNLVKSLRKEMIKSKKGDRSTNVIFNILNDMLKEIDVPPETLEKLDEIDVEENEDLSVVVQDIRTSANDTLALKSKIEQTIGKIKKGDLSSLPPLIEETERLVEYDYVFVKDFLEEIRQIIKEVSKSKGRDEYIEIAYNVIDMIDRFYFHTELKDEESEYHKDKIRTYAREGTLYSPDNPYQEKGYLLVKKEEESFKLGTKGTKGITTCGICKMDNIIIYSAQKRGLDEGETIFNTCVDCGHKWVIR